MFNIEMLVLNAGLQGMSNDFINNYIGPIAYIVIAIIALTLIWKRGIRDILIFILIAVVGFVLIFHGPALFGANGALTNTGVNTLSKVGN